MKHVVCVPDGCADLPLDELGGKTPLEVARTPILDELAATGVVGSAQVIPEGMPPGSDVGNMSILGYEPSNYHTGRAPIEAASLGLRLSADQVAFRCNFVTVSEDNTMLDYTAAHPDDAVAAKIVDELNQELGSLADGIEFHAGLSYRHSMVAPASLGDAICAPPHDYTDQLAPPPTGLAAAKLIELTEASKPIFKSYDTKATQIWLWGQGPQPQMPSFAEQHGVRGGIVSAVDLVRGLGLLTDMEVATVEGATAWYDTNYEGKRDAALAGLANGLDLFVIHVEASDEAGHAGDIEEKVKALENWDKRILHGLVDGLEEMGQWRLVVMPDHATPIALRTHTTQPVPYVLATSDRNGPGGIYSETATADLEPIPGHSVMRKLLSPK